MNNITVVGSGYVGLSIAVLLSQECNVTVLDIDKSRVSLINKKKSTFSDLYIEDYLENKELNLKATSNNFEAYANADFIVIATPTNYDEDSNKFDVSIVKRCIEEAHRINNEALIIIKSTIPIGFTQSISDELKTNNIIFSPEFLREGNALYDNLYPSRIVLGGDNNKMSDFGNLLKNSSLKEDVNVMCMSSTDAESVKLFSNSYLAMRIAYFNEIDTYAEIHNLSSKNIIDAVCLDPRIGDGYNNPSFGYGGYCLPKDTKQLKANFSNVNESIISAIVESNSQRLDHIYKTVMSRKPKSIGFYRLVMKKGSDNIRSSASGMLLEMFIKQNIQIFVYEPAVNLDIDKVRQLNDLNEFQNKSDVILVNRMSDELNEFKNLYSRDIYNVN